MSLKQELIAVLEQNRNENKDAVSGQSLANQFGVSRAAVWKTIQSLKQEGWEIEATTNKGYRLADTSDILSEEGIYAALGQRDAAVVVLPTVDSTNNYAKKLAADPTAIPHGTLVLAEQQTAGRGRMGRSFYSPAQTGVYMSVILRPNLPMEESLKTTVAAAVAVCRGVKEQCGVAPSIKWVNDIFLDGRKICGILSEAVGDFESGMTDCIVVGIGINISTKDFPASIEGVAGSVGTGNRSAVAAAVYRHLMALCEDLSSPALMEEYRRRNFVLGREVSYMKEGEHRSGVAKNINDDGNLVVETAGGIDVLYAGEISIGSKNL